MADLRASGLGGVPKGNTANRPSSPSLGDVYYNGQIGVLEIYNGSEWLACSAPPTAPTSVTIVDNGSGRPYNNGSLTYTFTAGTGGGLVNKYYIYYGSSVAETTSSPYTFTGLPVGTANAYVSALNNFGSNNSSIQSIQVTTVPQSPTITLSDITSTGAVINVSGNTGGKSITNYQYSTDGTNFTALSPAQTTSPITINGLNSSTSYTIYIKAVNENGTSSASSPISFTTGYSVDYVVVGGGAGAGGYYYTGGGGAGAMLTGSTAVVNGTAYTVTVGAGGAQQDGPGGVGNSGNSSTFRNIIAYGGIGSSSSITNYIGGAQATISSGGGGGGYGGDSEHTAGGGGGAGGAGSSGNTSAGNGGIGIATSISGSSIYYGGGGGGSAYNNYPRGSGGTGGGGNGTKGSSPQALGSAGGTNTGGGGGGASHPALGASYGYGWAGGSGIIVIKIPSTRTATFTGGVTASLNTGVSGYKIYTITAAGLSDTVTFS